MRQIREEQGLDLRQVAEMLHIRFPYLQAIENSSIGDLPGPVYALGFVKSYADHLGLDSEPLVERFKAEQRGLSSKTELVFPSPLSEGKVPSAAILIISAVMVVVAYSGWMYFSDAGGFVAEVVPPLPENLKRVTDQRQTAGSAAKASADNKTVEVGPAMATPKVTETVDSKGDAALASLTASRTNEPKAAVPSENADSSSAPPIDLHVGEKSEQSEQEEPIAVTLREPKIYGVDTGDSRIVISAISPAWVEISDIETDQVLLTRVLYAGDRYLAPNKTGLVLMTGNAGGIEIMVDGENVPSIGPKGSVRRNIWLDPVALRQGNAIRDMVGLQQQPNEKTQSKKTVP